MAARTNVHQTRRLHFRARGQGVGIVHHGRQRADQREVAAQVGRDRAGRTVGVDRGAEEDVVARVQIDIATGDKRIVAEGAKVAQGALFKNPAGDKDHLVLGDQFGLPLGDDLLVDYLDLGIEGFEFRPLASFVRCIADVLEAQSSSGIEHRGIVRRPYMFGVIPVFIDWDTVPVGVELNHITLVFSSTMSIIPVIPASG